MATSEPSSEDENAPMTETMLSTFAQRCLESDTRERIHDLLLDLPGLNKSRIAEQLDLHISTVVGHLEVMEAYGVIEIEDTPHSNEKLCFAAENVHLWEDHRTRILFGRGPLKHVAICLAENPGATVKEIADALGLKPGAVYPHVRRLAEHGLVRSEPIGGAHRHCATPPLEAWVQEVGEAYTRERG